MHSIADKLAGYKILWRAEHEKGPVELGQLSDSG